ncbi:hypothetical protein [Rhizobium lusitanum]|uniref:hypothetical protein n=1 Tax=Rhizobium lusitanum TaxID=293958 RepID=UPI0015719312|nr:hypothetical protein [Rhizobium lusitanum]NTJ11789.1 hypothetical protein [Rhizobium lusitanum]
MYLSSKNGGIVLVDAQNFKEFHLETARGGAIDLPSSIVADPDGEHVWVAIDWLSSIGPTGDVAWAEQFAKMIDKVKPFGWISEDGLFVRGHIKRL